MDLTNIKHLQSQMNQGTLTSKALVAYCLERIATYDGALNSLGDLNHHANALAEALDQERALKGPRSLLHGIPIVVKDNIFTNDSMRTTANAQVFGEFYAPYDATIVQKLREAGAIILAKANCSEFAYFMAMGTMPSGYGSMFGQVVHPYDRTIDPLGSSTGSSVAVAAELVPLSIGTETNGSLVSPAKQQGIVTVKPTLGLVSRHGIIPISFLQDTAGPMSTTVEGSALLLDIIKGVDGLDPMTESTPHQNTKYLEACGKEVKNIRIGLLSFDNYANDDREKKALEDAKNHLESLGAIVQEVTFTYEMISNAKTLIPEFKRDLNYFLASLHDKAPVKNLLEIIRFNLEKPQKRLRYGQSIFLASEATNGTLKDSNYLEARASLMASVSKFESLFDDHQIDVLMTTKISGYAPIGGFPVIAVPAADLNHEAPLTVCFIGKKWTEETLFTVAHAYEQKTQYRKSPTLEDYRRT